MFHHARVYTAYEYLESRFDSKTRALGSVIFLAQRGLSAGITIYAPAIILSAILGWPLQPTIIGLGLFITFYTVVGGARAVSQTQKQQMIVMLGGIVVVEVIFGYPGLGDYLLASALFKDFNAIEAGAMILVTVAVATQLLADVVYTFINPRIRYS